MGRGRGEKRESGDDVRDTLKETMITRDSPEEPTTTNAKLRLRLLIDFVGLFVVSHSS